MNHTNTTEILAPYLHTHISTCVARTAGGGNSISR